MSSRYIRRMSDPLAELLDRHHSDGFPDAIDKGEQYGLVDAVLIDADIVGWAQQAESLAVPDRRRLRLAADELRRSLDDFPTEARPYYERLLRIAELAIGSG